MSGLIEALGAETYEFEKDGKKYILSEKTLDDWAELEKWALKRLFDDTQYRLNLLPPEEKELRTKLLNVYAESKREIELDSSPYMSDALAQQYSCWLMLRHNHPGITLIDAGKLLSQRIFGEIYRKLHHIKIKEEKAVPPAET